MNNGITINLELENNSFEMHLEYDLCPYYALEVNQPFTLERLLHKLVLLN